MPITVLGYAEDAKARAVNKSTKSPEPSSPFARYEIEDRLKEVYNATWTTRDAVRLREILRKLRHPDIV